MFIFSYLYWLFKHNTSFILLFAHNVMTFSFKIQSMHEPCFCLWNETDVWLLWPEHLWFSAQVKSRRKRSLDLKCFQQWSLLGIPQGCCRVPIVMDEKGEGHLVFSALCLSSFGSVLWSVCATKLFETYHLVSWWALKAFIFLTWTCRK